MAEKSEINSSTNYSGNSSCVFLQTTEIILFNRVNKREIKVKTLFDQGSQMSYVTERVKSFLKLTSHENMSISTFGNKTLKKKELRRVFLNLKNALGSYFPTEILCTGFICLPLKYQLVRFTQNNYSHLQNLNLTTGADTAFERS